MTNFRSKRPQFHLMLPLLILAATSERRSKRPQIYPIIRRQCEVNIFQHTYSFKMLSSSISKYSKNEFTYYISLCGELEEHDLPNYNHSTFDIKDVQAARCQLQSGSSDIHECRVIAYESDFDWKPLNSSNWSQGIIYYSEVEPTFQAGSTDIWESFDLQVNIFCGSDGSTDLKGSWSIEDIMEQNEQVTVLTLTIPNSVFGCQQDGPMPSPTPSPYDPECNFTNIFPNLAGFGVDFTLKDINKFPYGTHTQLNINGIEKILFYQPCERIECPPGYSCQQELPYNFSSAWLCDVYKNKNGIYECESYGIASTQDRVDIGVMGFELSPKIYVQHHHLVEQGRSTILTLKCDSKVPKGHVVFEKESELNQYNLTIKGKSADVCLKIVPTPAPRPPGSSCSFNAQTYDKLLSANLDRYDLNTSLSPLGWNKTVEVEGTPGISEAELYYNPCLGSITCPNGAFCNGDDFANVFLCHESTEHPLFKRLCDAYGLNAYGLQMSLYNNNIKDGFNAIYKGDLRKTATVHYKCNSQLAEKDIVLPDKVKLSGFDLTFDVFAEGACVMDKPDPSPSPSPTPEWYPPYPTQGPTPTPTPLPSPNGLPIFHNETHYIMVSFDQLRQNVFSNSATIIAPSISSSIKIISHVEYHPWTLIPCPAGYNCLGHDMANVWFCWDEGPRKNICHASADKRIKDVELIPFNERNLDMGTRLIYKGQYGFDFKISVECDNFESENSIPWDLSAVPIYNIDLQGPQINILFDSKHVCPHKFESPSPLPLVTPTPTPDPKIDVDYNFISQVIDRQYIDLDIKKMENKATKVLIGYYSHYEYSYLSFLPSIAKECPIDLGYECAGTGGSIANVWKCSNDKEGKKICTSLGWSNQSLHFSLVNQKSLLDGVYVEYGGGYQNRSAKILLQCNESLADNQIIIDEVANQFPQNPLETVIYVKTKLVCPISLPNETTSKSPISPSQSPISPSQSSISPSQSPIIPSQSSIIPSQSSIIPSQSSIIPSQSSIIEPTKASDVFLKTSLIVIIVLLVIIVLMISIALIMIFMRKNKSKINSNSSNIMNMGLI